MTEVAIAESFLDALGRLDAADTRRATSFLGKLVTDPSAPGLKPRIVHDAAERSIRSLNVTHDLRAIAHMSGDRITLLHVARHDRAYVWARERCIGCHKQDDEHVMLVARDDAGSESRFTLCGTVDDVCKLLDGKGILHALH